VANEIITAAAGKLVPRAHDGYASSPLTTAIGKTILADFSMAAWQRRSPGKVKPALPGHLGIIETLVG